MTAELYSSSDPPSGMAAAAAVPRRIVAAETVSVGQRRQPVGVGIRGRRRLADCGRILRLGELLVPVASGRHRHQRRPAASGQHPAAPSRESLGVRHASSVCRLVDGQLYGPRVLDRRAGDPGLDRPVLARWRDRRAQLQGRPVHLERQGHEPRRTAPSSTTSSAISFVGGS